MGMDPLGEDWFCEDFVELNGKRFSREDWCRDDYVEVDVASPWADNEKKNLDDPVENYFLFLKESLSERDPQDLTENGQSLSSSFFDPYSGYINFPNTGMMADTSSEAPGLVSCQTPPSINMTSVERDMLNGNRSPLDVKVRRGLEGYANKSKVSALADTGSTTNVVSGEYARRMGLEIRGNSVFLQLGNSRKVHSTGYVSLRWAFAENPKKSVRITCRVLPNCVYDMILGNKFLTATKTMSKYRHRLTNCFFSVAKRFHRFGFLGESSQRLEGTIADAYNVFAIPDSGAERNVMDWDFANAMGLKVKRKRRHRGWLQFADGTCQETEGQVDTFWTFANGTRIPVTFEVLNGCCADVVLGDDILAEHNVFEDHASSLISEAFDPDSYGLATFDFIRRWQKRLELFDRKNMAQGGHAPSTADHSEQSRREFWDFTYDFGARANAAERELERTRRCQYNSSSSGHDRMARIPSISTAPSRQRR